jgi:hypothetical protein
VAVVLFTLELEVWVRPVRAVQVLKVAMGTLIPTLLTHRPQAVEVVPVGQVLMHHQVLEVLEALGFHQIF